MGKICVKILKKNEISHYFLIKVTFSKIWNLCVCRMRFKNSIFPKKRFFVRTFEKGGGAKKSFGFYFLIILEIIKKFPLDLDFFPPPPPPPPLLR